MRGWLSLDVLAASLAVALLVSAGSALLLARADALSQTARLWGAQREAWSESARLLSTCPSEGGLARCSRGFIFENVLEPSASPRASNASVRLFPAGEEPPSGPEGARVCVRRLALLEGMEWVVEACAPAG